MFSTFLLYISLLLPCSRPETLLFNVFEQQMFRRVRVKSLPRVPLAAFLFDLLLLQEG